MTAVSDLAPVVSIPRTDDRRTQEPGAGLPRLRLVGAPDTMGPVALVGTRWVPTPPLAREVVDDLHPNSGEHARESTLRLTQRGWLVVVAATFAAAATLVWSAYLSAPGASAEQTVTVRPGDTLWGVAAQIAPHRDSRLVVAELQQANGLHGTVLVPGQRLHVG